MTDLTRVALVLVHGPYDYQETFLETPGSPDIHELPKEIIVGEHVYGMSIGHNHLDPHPSGAIKYFFLRTEPTRVPVPEPVRSA